MVLFTHHLTLLVAFSNSVSSSMIPSYALTETGPSISPVVPNSSSSGVEWYAKTNEMIQRYQDLGKFQDHLLRDDKSLVRSQSSSLMPPSQVRIDYKDERYKRSRSDLTTHRRANPTNIKKLKSDLLAKLDRIEKNLQKIVTQDGTMKYEGKRVYTTEELKHIESKVKELKNGNDYIHLGDGKFVRVEEESCDISGVFGKIRAFDEDGKTILYETGCCYYNWNSISPEESSLLEHLVWITACLPLKTAYHFTGEIWKKFEQKFLDGLTRLC